MKTRTTPFPFRIIYFMGAFIVFATIAAFIARSIFAPGDLSTGQPTDPNQFQSGPQVGSKVPGPFEPLNINGKSAGEEECLFCRFGNAPTVMVFASKPTKSVTDLVPALEKAAASGAKAGEVGACLIVTESDEPTKAALTKLADSANLKQVVLGMIEPQGVKKYKINPEAEVTVLLYSKQVVRVNHVYKPGELTEKAIAELSEEAAKFLAEK